MTGFSDFAVGEPLADLSLTKDDGVTMVTAGDGVTYTYLLTVTNGGPSDATGSVLSDSWPAGFDQGAVTASQGTCAASGGGPDFDCDLGTIAVGGSATVSVDFTVPADTASGNQTNSATVSGDLADPDLSDDAATDTDEVVEVADLIVAKDDGEATVAAGTGGYAYTIVVTNEGPSDADGVSLADDVPAAVSVGSPSADLGGDCSASSGNAVACFLPSTLGVGETWTVTIPYDVDASAPLGDVVNTATVVSDEDPVGVDASDTTEIVGESDLAVSKDDGATTVNAGDGATHTYTITIDNGGPSVATGVTIVDSWPVAFSRGTIVTSQGTCGSIGSGSDFACAIGDIAVGASATVSVTFTVPADAAGGIQTNSVTVAGDQFDPDADDDTATDADTVAAASPTATPDASQMPDSGMLEPGSMEWLKPLLPATLLLFAVGVGLLAVGLWEARRRRPPGRRRHGP
jgi:uncharacterized repeat protein (TIGR01451 family)